MTLWVILTVMTVMVGVAVAAPFLRDRPLSGADQSAPASDESAKPSAVSAYGLAGFVALAATLLYAGLGRPDLPARPLTNPVKAARAEATAKDGAFDALKDYVQNLDAPAGTQSTAEPESAGLAPVGDMIERLAQRLKTNPGDREGWRMLGWSYASQDRYGEAADAYAKAIALAPEDGALKAARGEALAEAAHGRIEPEAKALFEDAIRLDPANLKALYYLGRHDVQSGNKAAALETYLKVLAGTPADTPWAAGLRTETMSLARDLGIDISSRLPPRDGASAGSATGPTTVQNPGSGPTAEDVQRAEAMPQADRSTMILGMVDRLEKRLEAAPRDVEGWIKLMRSRHVLGDIAAARSARDRAVAIFATGSAEHAQIATAARELGISE